MAAYRDNVLYLLKGVLQPSSPVASALDFGSGDGWFADQFERQGLARRVVPVEVARRHNMIREPIIYDGATLPFADRSFELGLAVDTLHHCPDPVKSLKEILRCTDKLLAIKDHNYKTFAGWCALALLDELGNRRFGVKSNYQYQKSWEWLSVIEAEGFELVRMFHPAPCDTRPPFVWFTNRLQFVALWKRS